VSDPLDLPKGVAFRRNAGGIPVLSVHYSADPERDPDITPEWRETERRKYSSQGAWDREQEIHATAGGGELVFAYTLRKHWKKIVITDPEWRPDPLWTPMGGFDHGKTNPTAALVARIDFTGTIYFCGEYYMNMLGPRDHAPNLRKLPGFFEAEEVMADPSIFHKNQAQADGSFRALSELYHDAGLETLRPAKNDELTGMERILDHWRDLDNREPTLKIVCRLPHDRKQLGLFPNDCPNLLWELMRTMREQLTAVQLMKRNPSEKIVDKDNHLRDTAKYIVLRLPEPTEKPREMRILEATKDMDPMNAFLKRQKVEAEMDKEEAPIRTGGMALRKGIGLGPKMGPGGRRRW
jgi:hypothetical protein